MEKEKDFYPQITKKIKNINKIIEQQLVDYNKIKEDYDYIKNKRRSEKTNDNRTDETGN